MKVLITKTKVLVVFFCLLALASCKDYGKKVTFANTKGEVYYKGDGVTEANAKAVGNFLDEQGYFAKDDKVRTVQITKVNNRIQVRFVIDEKSLSAVKDADESFVLMGAMMSKQIFNNTPVDVIYTNVSFKDIKTLPFDESSLSQVNAFEDLKKMEKKNYNNNTLYYKNITAEDADAIINYMVKTGFFSEQGTNTLIAEKLASGAFHFKFPVQTSFANEEGLQKIDAFVKQMKIDLFPNDALEFEAVDDKMKSIKTFSY